MAFKFEKLIVWQKAVILSTSINKVIKAFPKEETYILSSQLQRAADSVSLNIAEGSTGQSNAEFKRFLGYATRSIVEVVTGIYLAKSRGIISTDKFIQISGMWQELLVITNSLKNSIK